MATTPKVLTYEEWLKMPEAEGIEEVVQGEIRKIPPNKIIHADVVENLSDLLKAQLDRKTVQVRVSTFGLVIRRDPVTTRVPDIAVFIRKNVMEQDGYIHSAPELVVEVLSPGNTRTEQTEKLKDYKSLGVPEVWVISPEAQTVEVMLLKEGWLNTVALLREGQLRPSQFPGAAVDIDLIWPK
ncbi:MAG TPA: Uma2 family endonuclease [Bryobacteraceae bacterium]|jgi:Uma2 family endonuclease|nr:Uma2 family endonuclease [Bryobacteraceae bacterium]